MKKFLEKCLGGLFLVALIGGLLQEIFVNHIEIVIIAAILGVGILMIKSAKWKRTESDVPAVPSPAPQSELDKVTITVEEPIATADPALASKISTPSIDGSGGKLVYDRVGIYRPAGACGPMPRINQFIFLQLDPENPYDSEAIRAVYFDDEHQLQIAGYMNRTKLREMVRDWIDRGDELDCFVEENDPKLYVTMTFYK